MSQSRSAGYETIDGEPGRSPSATNGPAIGNSIGRYVILGRLGAGAMGVVYAAWDPELDRRVAIKVLHPDVRPGSEGKSRLLREAQALAKLSHPNVVTVHDVGTVDERVWIAMEFVEGITLEAWLRASKRSWQEALALMEEAGRGLAAAHAAGVVHRDFKPENVMVSADGRVRVMDFGLARAEPLKAAPASQSSSGSSSDSNKPDRGVSVTRTGAMLGTPAYMAPEQHSRLPADVRSDQFSYCVSLWQAVYRERPYGGETAVELAANVIAGRIRPTPAGVRVPKWLRQAMVRGLSSDPEFRWPTMDALLAEIARGRARERMRKPLLFAGALALVGAAVVVAQQVRERAQVESCREDSAALASTWADARARVQQAVSAAAIADADLTADRILANTDHEVEEWTRVSTRACLDARVDARWDDDTYERASWCLAVRRIEIETFLVALSDQDVDHVRVAIDAVDQEFGIAPCGDAAHLAYVPAPPPELRGEALVRMQELLRLTQILADDDYETALAAAQAELARNEQLGWAPLVAESRLRVGDLLSRVGRFDEAERVLEDAYFEAAHAGALDGARSAATSLVYTVGARLARFREGLRWAREAELVLAQLGEDDGLEMATLLSHRAAVEYAMAEFDAARASVERALSIREHELPPEHTWIAESVGHLANVEAALGNIDSARELLKRALAIDENALGSGHPQVAVDLVNLGNLERQLGNLDEAERLLERGIAVQRRALGPEHPDIATTLNNLAALQISRGDIRRGRTLVEQSIAIKRAALGPEHPEIALGLFNLAGMVDDLGDLDEARRFAEQSLAMYEATVGGDHREVAFVLHFLGSIALRQKRFGDAVTLLERELAIREANETDRDQIPAARDLLEQARLGALQ